MLYWENNNILTEKLITVDLIPVWKRIKIEKKYFNFKIIILTKII
jgi:hypothetical protein